MKRILTLLVLAFVSACSKQAANYPPDNPYDPYERQNRAIHGFNKGVDRNVLRPVSKGYNAVVPDPIETAISNFATNASTPSSVVNNALRMDMVSAFQDLGRFVVNTTIGLGGIFDPATELKMPPSTDTDFGQVLYAMDVGEGPYLEVPFLGPSTTRRAVGRVVDLFTNPLEYVIPSPGNYVITGTTIASRIGERGRYASTIDSVLYESADSYAQTRLLYLQNRRYKLGRDRGENYSDPYSDPYADPGKESATSETSTTTAAEAASATYEDPYDE